MQNTRTSAVNSVSDAETDAVADPPASVPDATASSNSASAGDSLSSSMSPLSISDVEVVPAPGDSLPLPIIVEHSRSNMVSMTRDEAMALHRQQQLDYAAQRRRRRVMMPVVYAGNENAWHVRREADAFRIFDDFWERVQLLQPNGEPPAAG